MNVAVLRARRWLWFGVLASLLVTVGCGNEDARATSPRNPASTSPAAQGSAQQFQSLFGGIAYDFEPMTPNEISDLSDLIVIGKIVDIQPGRTYKVAGDEGWSSQSLLLRLHTDQVIKADSPPEVGSDVYVELPSSGGVSAAVYDAAAPKEATVLLYLRRAGDPNPVDDAQVAEVSKAWEEAGEVMEPTNPQSFVIGSEDRVFSVMTHGVSNSDSLEDYLPTSVRR